MKTDIRQRLLKRRQSLSEQDSLESSQVISRKLTELKCVSEAKCIMAYLAFRNEVDLKQFLEFCKEKSLCIALPRITGDGIMESAEYDEKSNLQKNKYGIYEPAEPEAIEKSKIDVIVVPAVAFNKQMYRLGYGGGYYDRFLEDTDAVKIGVCFDFQIVDTLPREQHDIKMDIVISEKRTLGDVL